ncbi:MAG: sterol desaturase family protein [Deltaproteobacteria bacterium]|nr:sterol desaturase family protein [Deltaproteobacteria bacterium]
MKVLFVILASYTSAGLAIALLLYAYRSTAAQQYLISDDPHRSTGDRELYWRVALNTTVSITLIFAVMYGLGTYLYYDHAAPAWRYLLEAATVILIYDFGYYFVHRYPFHEWKILRGVHSVHHASRNPRVIDSLLLHPVETILGLGLFFGSVALVGGVHIKTLGVLAAKHDRHHHSMLSGNYASITPLPDIIFGTVE